MLLVTEVYKATQTFPSAEMYGLVSQMRRSAVSIPSNMAEGYGRNSTGDYKRFLHIAVGSLFELQTQLDVSLNINYLSKEKYAELIEKANEIDRMTYSLIKK